MAAYRNTVQLQPRTFTPITSGAVTSSRGVNLSSGPIWVQATADTTPPTSLLGAVPYQPGQGWNADSSFEGDNPDIGAQGYLWAYCDQAGAVSVAHG